MSKCDQNCLLSVLWDKGSSVAILDISNSKKRADSNRFIKKMCHGDDSWDIGDSKEMLRKNEFYLSFSHLSVTPREIMEARGFQKKDTVCELFEVHSTDGVLKKNIFVGYLPFDKLIFNSIYAVAEKPDDVLRFISNREVEDYKFVQGLPSRFFKFKFKWCTDKEPRKTIRNVGQNQAMKQIFFSKQNTETIAAGNIPILNKQNTSTNFSCDYGLFLKKTYKRTLHKPVKQALNRQNDYRKCLDTRSDKWGNLVALPYSQNIFVKNWRKQIQKHLVDINKSQFMHKNGRIIRKFNLYNANGSKMFDSGIGLDMFTFFKSLLLKEYNLGEAAFFAPINLDVKDWYKLWLKEYKRDLQKAKSMKHGDIVSDFVHKHYKEIKHKSYRSVPLKWLQENKLFMY